MTRGGEGLGRGLTSRGKGLRTPSPVLDEVVEGGTDGVAEGSWEERLIVTALKVVMVSGSFVMKERAVM